jgi:hypothetical protein
MTDTKSYSYATHLDIKFPSLDLIDVEALAKSDRWREAWGFSGFRRRAMSYRRINSIFTQQISTGGSWDAKPGRTVAALLARLSTLAGASHKTFLGIG